jgi:hypothetical protein
MPVISGFPEPCQPGSLKRILARQPQVDGTDPREMFCRQFT